MACPKAKPICAHAEVEFCSECKVVHCLGCDESWGGAKRGAGADELRAFRDLLHEQQKYEPMPKTPDWAIPMRRGSVQGGVPKTTWGLAASIYNS